MCESTAVTTTTIYGFREMVRVSRRRSEVEDRDGRLAMNRFIDWKEARAEAQKRADASGLDVGLWRVVEFGKDGFNIRYLPKPENRYGHELQCEVVRPQIAVDTLTVSGRV